MPKIISLFTGAGGLDYGFEAAGFDTAVAVELDESCRETLRKNRPSWALATDTNGKGDILNLPTEAILEAGKLKSGDVDVLIGGPPCQPFSKSGYWHRGDSLRLDDPRASTLSAYLRVLAEARPRVFLLENVEGLAYDGKDEGLRLLLDAIKEINKRTRSHYAPVFKVLSAADYGVPQYRNRFFMVASRDGKAFEFPAPTHQDVEGLQSTLFNADVEPHRTAWDALGDLEPPASEDLRVRGKWAALLPSIPEGENYLWHTSRGGGRPLFGWRRRFWNFLLKLAKSRPSWTIQAQPGPAVGPFHWTSRRLSVRELCRLQTFPDDVHVVGERGAVQRQVGNAVPSLLAEVLARQVRAQLLGMTAGKKTPRLLPPKRVPVPRPELVTPVPRAFLHLVGDHEPHPGTGRGYAALARSDATGRVQ